MCRLLGCVAPHPVTVDEVLGEGRQAFFDLARVHGDGWGHAWSTGQDLHVRKAPESAIGSAELAALAAGTPSVASLTHLRWATLGLDVRPENTHPFTDGRVAFAHNGSVAPPSQLDPLVAPGLAAQRGGDTDSERYFLAVLSRMQREDPQDALVHVVDDIVGSGARVHSLNSLLLTPDALYAVCSYDAGSHADPDYYPLLYRTGADGVVVTSTGWADSTGWRLVSNGEMLVVDRRTLATTLVPVATPRAVAQVAP